MNDGRGHFLPQSRSFSRSHSSGRWQSRTILDFPSSASTSTERPKLAEPTLSKHLERPDLEELLAQVAELNAQLAEDLPRGPAEIRQFPRRYPDST